ncbi:MAG: hypothetical protein EPO22_09280 [Dehalococcoidia bacterium]|nr:MAG: hypothetical protein EPO22_09280 [Dehalococcoidia bacterium]
MMAQAGGMDLNALVQRLRRLATLDTSVFDEVRTDTNSTIPAVVVTVAATLLSGVGGWLWWLFADFGDSGKVFVQSVILGSILSVILFGIWIAITYVMLTQVFRARADVNELVRVMGFASAPLALTILMFIPGLDFGIGLAATALFFATTVLAVQTATDAPAGRALVATLAGFAVWAIVLGLLTTKDHTWAPGFFVMDRPVDALKDLASAFSSF